MKTELPKAFYHYRIHHGESGTVYTAYFVDNEETVDMFSWNAKENGLYLAEDFCKRHNRDHLGIDYEDLKKVFIPSF